MGPVLLDISERDIIKVFLEFLESRNLHITQLSLERETGIINGQYSDDILFLRQLILDGQWDSALDFVQPLRSLGVFDHSHFNDCISIKLPRVIRILRDFHSAVLSANLLDHPKN